jgi:hypothetical protein
MRRAVSGETFRRAGKTTQPALPTLPEQRVSELEILSLLETIDDILTEFDRPTCVSKYKNHFLETFMQGVDDCTTQYKQPIHSIKTVNNMPQTSPTSAASSSHSSRNSEHFPYRYVNLENVRQVFNRRENITTAINLVNNNQTAFAEITFLDYLLQNIRRSEIRLEKDKQLARARITRLLTKKSSDKLYQWIVNYNLDTPFHLPIGSLHTPPETHTPSSISHLSHSPKPKPIRIRRHTQSEIDRINTRREFLSQNFPEDYPKGTFANPILVEDDGNSDNDNKVLLTEK